MITTLPPLDSPRLLLSFDFDGTLHQPQDGWHLDATFFDHIAKMREEHGALWLINTGRSLFQMVQGFGESRFPFLPDLLIVREREIFQPTQFGRWVDLGDWNKKGEKDHKKLFKKSARALKKLKKFVTQETQAEWIESKDEPAGIIAKSLAEMAHIASHIDAVCAGISDLSYERNSIYLRFSHGKYNKGSALQQVQSLSSVGVENTFAIGDGHNDLTMLHPSVASHLACPANAIPDVKDIVSASGGHVSQMNASHGALDALRTFFPSNS